MKRVNVFLPQCLSLIFALRFHFISLFFLFFGAFQGFNEIYFVFFSFAHCAVWTRHCLCLHWRQERWLFLCILSYLSPSGGKSALGNMPPSSVSGCCFASAVAYLLWKCWSGALTACGWAWACWRQRWSQCASPADLCWGWRERRRSSRWMHPHHWPPGEREGLTRTDRIRGKVGGKKRREDSKKKKGKEKTTTGATEPGQFRKNMMWTKLPTH